VVHQDQVGKDLWQHHRRHHTTLAELIPKVHFVVAAASPVDPALPTHYDLDLEAQRGNLLCHAAIGPVPLLHLCHAAELELLDDSADLHPRPSYLHVGSRLNLVLTCRCPNCCHLFLSALAVPLEAVILRIGSVDSEKCAAVEKQPAAAAAAAAVAAVGDEHPGNLVEMAPDLSGTDLEVSAIAASACWTPFVPVPAEGEFASAVGFEELGAAVLYVEAFVASAAANFAQRPPALAMP